MEDNVLRGKPFQVFHFVEYKKKLFFAMLLICNSKFFFSIWICLSYIDILSSYMWSHFVQQIRLSPNMLNSFNINK